MDSKKANLTPELKEIYDRVMNTSGTPKSAPQNQPQQPHPSTMAASSAQPGLNQAPQGMPSIGGVSQMPPSPSVQQPQMPPPPAQQGGGQPQLDATTPMNGGIGVPTPAEEALSSTPARAVSEGNSFAFSGGNTKSPHPQQQTTKPTGEKKKAFISKPILIVLGVVFVVVWGVFWAIIFGFIER